LVYCNHLKTRLGKSAVQRSAGRADGVDLSLKKHRQTVSVRKAYRGAAQKAMPSVVNIYTSKEIQRARNPLLNDPFLRRFFGEQSNQRTERQSSLGSASSLVLKVIS
jgi:S1-C subfamily serine protease